MQTANIDLFEKPLYTVHVNGLFGVTTKASVTKKFTGTGLMDQISEPHLYQRLSESDIEEFLTQQAFSRQRERQVMFHTGPRGHEMLDRAIRDEVARGREVNLHIQDEAGQFPRVDYNAFNAARPTHYQVGFAPAVEAPGIDGTTFSITLNEGWHIPQDILEQTQQQLLQTQLRNGEITMFEYLDAISEL